jgi:hypothetical protein
MEEDGMNKQKRSVGVWCYLIFVAVAFYIMAGCFLYHAITKSNGMSTASNSSLFIVFLAIAITAHTLIVRDTI